MADAEQLYQQIVDGAEGELPLAAHARPLQRQAMDRAKHGDVAERIGALRVAAALGRAHGLAITRELLADTDPRVRAYAFNQAVAARRAGISLLRYAARGPDAGLAAEALRLLSLVLDRGAVPIARSLVSHPDPKVRARCAELLGRMAGAGALVPLRQLAEDPDPTVQAAAAEACELLEGEREAVRPGQWWDDENDDTLPAPPLGPLPPLEAATPAATEPPPPPVAPPAPISIEDAAPENATPAPAEPPPPVETAPPPPVETAPPDPAPDALAASPSPGEGARLPLPFPELPGGGAPESAPAESGTPATDAPSPSTALQLAGSAPPEQVEATPPPGGSDGIPLPAALPEEPRALLRLLGQIAPRDLGPVLDALRPQREAVVTQLSTYPPGSDPALGRGLAVAAAQLGTGSWLIRMRPLLADPDPAVRQASLAAFATHGGGAAIPRLTSTLADEDPGVRARGIEALHQLCERVERPEILRQWVRPLVDDPAAAVRAAARRALGLPEPSPAEEP